MPAKYYLDSCIWIDYAENRSDRFRPLGEWALALINQIIKNADFVVISDHLIKELCTKYPYPKIEGILCIVPENLVINVKINEQDTKNALDIKHKYGLSFGDALHAAIARENNCILVTRDKHFFVLEEDLQIRKPEELI
jgi:predicted nucleic acid-binding protein